MSFLPGSSTRVLANEVEVSSEIAGWTMGYNRAMSEVTCVGQPVGNAGSNFIPGLMSGTLGLRGPHGTVAANGIQKEITDAIGVDNNLIVTALPDGVTVGKPAISILGDPTEYAVDAPVADAVSATLTAQADETVDYGFVLAPLQAYTADALTGTAVDRGASPLTPTTGGAAGFLHVLAYSGFTGVVVKLQHSPDNSAWSDLITFANVTAIGSQRVAVPKGTTVNRYLRASVDVTGSGSITLLASGAPR